MFEINPSRKIKNLDNEVSDNNSVQQRAFLDEPQDTLELSTKKKKSVSFDSAIKDAIKTFTTLGKPPQSGDTDNSEQEAKSKNFVRPAPNYPNREYSSYQLDSIDRKFEKIKSGFVKDNDPDDDNAFMYTTPVLKDLEKIKKLVLNTKDSVIQDVILKLLSETKDYDLPTEFQGSFKHINIFYDYSNLVKVYQLAKISALIDNDMAKLGSDNRFSSNLDEKLLSNNNFETFEDEEITKANDSLNAVFMNEGLTDSEKQMESERIIHNMQLSKLSSNISELANKYPELKDHLYGTYLKPNIPQEYQKDLEDIQKATGKTMFPIPHSNFTQESLENFADLSDMAKQHYLRHPEMCSAIYLYKDDNYLTETPYQALSNLTNEEWEIFEKRNLADVLGVLTGYNISSFKIKTGSNIHTALEMSDKSWQKINDFKLFEINDKEERFTYRKHESLKFDFDEMLAITDNLSYDEWETAQKRGLVDMTSGKVEADNNYGRNIGVPILIAAAKVPNSTFRFLKDIKLFNNNQVTLKTGRESAYSDVAEGIKFLSNSHGDVYKNVETLIHNGISPEIALETLGVGAKNYNRFGKYMTEKTIELKQYVKEHRIPDLLPMYLDLQMAKGKSNINELSIDKKRSLLKTLIKYNAQLFDLYPHEATNSPIIPKNKEEYCALIPKLIKAIGIDTRPVEQNVIDKFSDAARAMSDKDSEFMNTRFSKEEPTLELEYSRADFIKDIQENVRDLNDTEKAKVYDYFGFDLKYNKDNVLQMHGYPVNLNNGAKLAEIQDEKTKEIIENIRPFVEKFSNNNRVTISGKPELSNQLNDILELFPEFRTTIGKEQHATHDFTVDKHTLKVLQGVMSDERYGKLSDEDKKILNIATLLHDLTKSEKTIDKTHPAYSAYDTYHILNKMNMSEKDKIKIYQIIKNHDWLEKYNGKVKENNTYREKTSVEKLEAAKDIAFELKDDNNFELANILTKADMKAVKETDEFFNKFETAFNSGTNEINSLIDTLRQTAIHLPQTKIPKASELKVDGKNVQEHNYRCSDGKELKYVQVNLCRDMDLGELGFEKGLNSNDLNVIVHALDKDSQSATFQALGSVDSDCLLSTSYVNYEKGNYHVFRPQGFVLDVNSSDIQAGTYMDFGSGYGKDLDTLKSKYLFNGERKHIRNFMSNKLKEKLGLTDDEYKKLYSEIADKSITDMDKTHPETAKTIREIFMDMEVHKRKYGRDYNEWLISRPKIQGVFIQGSKYGYETPPEFLVRYAAENNLPVIYFGE